MLRRHPKIPLFPLGYSQTHHAELYGNGIGIRGVAPEAKLIGYNALKVPSISNIADAFVQHKERVWVSSNSWGDFNSWGEPFALKSLEMAALEEGVTHGRDGRGIIYVFAAGNGASKDGGLPTDNVNYSGLVNNRYTIPVGAVDENGTKVAYSEVGATLMVVAPSRAAADSPGIVTTDATADKGYNPNTFKADYNDTNYTRYFSGTSASTPMVSGVVALILEANPKLGWRDVREILARSAAKTDPDDSDWSTNGAGLHINHKYGFGLVDACKAIELAWDWHNLPKQKMVEIHKDINITIPDNDPNGIESSITIDANLTVEFVDIFFDAHDHASLGDLEIILTSPFGTRSILAKTHVEAFDGYFRYKNWRFGSVRHLGEKSKGTWRLQVIDRQLGNEGTFFSWGLKVYGHLETNRSIPGMILCDQLSAEGKHLV